MKLSILLLTAVSACSGTASIERRSQPDAVRPQFFFADDVAPEVREAMEATMAAAVSAWGDCGPIEYWVVGADVAAAERLARRYCERRSRRGERSLADCAAEGGRLEEFRDWAARAAEIERTGEPFLDAGWNGGFEWGLHLFSSSLPPGWAGLADVRIEDDQTVLLHEYFHAIQQAHLTNLDWEERQRLMGPVWWVEGSAEFMAQVTSERLRASGALPRDPRHPGEEWNARSRMTDKLRAGIERLGERPGLHFADVDYGPDASVAYDLGCWAVAWLCDRAGPDVLIEDFYPRLERLGWEGAFRETFGMSSAEFYAEFERFLELPLEEQIRILLGE